jgi:hypothetical protein
MLLSSRGVIYAGQTGLEKFYYRSALGLRPAAADLYSGVGPRHKEMIPYFRFLCKVQGASYLLRHAADAQWAILINSPGDLCHQAQRYNMLMHTHARATQPSRNQQERAHAAWQKDQIPAGAATGICQLKRALVIGVSLLINMACGRDTKGPRLF